MNRIIRYSYPYNVNRGLESELSRFFDSTLSDFAAPAVAPRFAVDLYEDKDNAYVRAELPGVSREAINLEIADGYLTITATRKTDEAESSVNRSVSVPENVQADKVTAAYENGVLTVTLPKQEQAKPRKIDIAVN